MKSRVERRVMEGSITIPYNWTAGAIYGAVLESLRDAKRILGGKCQSCGKVWVPPQECCPECSADLAPEDLVPVADEGKVASFTVVEMPLIVRPCEPPYAIVAVRLDGAGTDFLHLVKDKESLAKLRVGARVRAVWKDERVGSILDIDGFVVV